MAARTRSNSLDFAMALEMDVQITDDKVADAIRALVHEGQPAEQSRPLLSPADVTTADRADAEEASALDGTMPLLTPYRVKDVSYWFGVPVTLVRWLKPVGSAVAEGEPLALVSVQATDLNTVSIMRQSPPFAPVAKHSDVLVLGCAGQDGGRGG